MDELRIFLDTHRTQDKKKTNFISLKGGKFCVPKQDAAKFFSLFATAAPLFTETTYVPLVYKTPALSLQPLMVDIDLRTRDTPSIGPNHHAKFAVFLARELARVTKLPGVSYFVVTKHASYQKKFKKATCHASGAHFYFPHVRIPLSVAKHILDYGVQHCLEYYGQFEPLNEALDIVDARVIKRSNGLCLLGSFKGPSTGGQYRVRLMGNAFADGRVEEQVLHKSDFFDTLEGILTTAYGFLWETQEGIPEEETETETLPAVPRVVVLPTKKMEPVEQPQKEPFCLKAFLDSTRGHTPNHAEWLQLVVFCATICLPRQETCELLNERFSPDDARENYRVFDTVKPGDSTVSRGSIIRYLQKHGVDVDWSAIFPEQTFAYYGEYSQFLFCNSVVWEERIVERYLQDTIAFVKEAQKFVYRDTSLMQDKHGNNYREVRTVVQDSVPFKKDDLIVRVQYQLDELVEKLRRNIPKRAPTDEAALVLYLAKRALLREVTGSGYTRVQKTIKIKEALQLGDRERTMSSMFTKLFHRGSIKRYDNLQFCPYLFRNPCLSTCYNTFQGFHLLKYTPRVIRDWKTTPVFDFLWEVYANKDSDRMNGMLNLFSWKIQNPRMRSERLTCLMSEAHGVGKSSLYRVYVALMGQAACCFYNNYTDFSSAFNSGQANRLIIFVDDVHDLSKKQQQVLNSRVSCERMRFNQKNERPYWSNVCDDIFFTTNDAVLYCAAEDRRQLHIKVGDAWYRDRVKFKALRQALANLDIMHNFFHYCAGRNLEDYHPANEATNPFSKDTNKMKVDNMRSSWQFMSDFFSNQDWVLHYKPKFEYCSTWGKAFQVDDLKQQVGGCPKGTCRIRIEASRFYNLYKAWVREKNPSQKTVYERTFYRQLSPLGVEVQHKKRIHGNRRKVVDVFFPLVQQGFRKTYPEFVLDSWPTEVPSERVTLLAMLELKGSSDATTPSSPYAHTSFPRRV